MSRAPLTLALSVALASVVSAQSDVLRTLGVSDADARDTLVTALAAGIMTPGSHTSTFNAAPSEQRVAIARGVVAFARAFTATADFAQRYAIYRASQRPARAAGARTGDEARAEQQRQMALAIKQAQDQAATLPADARRQLDENIAEMTRQIAEIDADPAYRAAVDAAARESAKQADETYAQQLAAFEQAYPANPNVLIARRLRRFLDLCRDVDYTARLEEGADRKRRFVDPRLEQQPSEWKMCYRAGKPAVDAARAAAEQWLTVLVQ